MKPILTVVLVALSHVLDIMFIVKYISIATFCLKRQANNEQRLGFELMSDVKFPGPKRISFNKNTWFVTFYIDGAII